MNQDHAVLQGQTNTMCGKFTLVGLFAPVNESIFEHAKLAFVPLAGWWMATYLLNRQKYAQVKNNFFAAGMASALSGTLIMPMLYYFYHAGLNIESLAVDILLLFVCIVAGQLAGRHVLFHGKNKFPAWASIAILVTFFVVCALCTLFAPHLSFFKESFSGKYGI